MVGFLTTATGHQVLRRPRFGGKILKKTPAALRKSPQGNPLLLRQRGTLRGSGFGLARNFPSFDEPGAK